MHARAAARLKTGPGPGFRVRPARPEDGDALLRVDQDTWSPYVSPAPAPPSRPFFSERTRPENVFVAEDEETVVGYAKMEHPTELPASEHVWHVNGLAVTPSHEGRGIGRALMNALIDEARVRGGLKMTLRVFAPNERARRLYERLGFTLEGVMRAEFRVANGELVDDCLMALEL